MRPELGGRAGPHAADARRAGVLDREGARAQYIQSLAPRHHRDGPTSAVERIGDPPADRAGADDGGGMGHESLRRAAVSAYRSSDRVPSMIAVSRKNTTSAPSSKAYSSESTKTYKRE